jgi:hypothetical protein
LSGDSGFVKTCGLYADARYFGVCGRKLEKIFWSVWILVDINIAGACGCQFSLRIL